MAQEQKLLTFVKNIAFFEGLAILHCKDIWQSDFVLIERDGDTNNVQYLGVQVSPLQLKDFLESKTDLKSVFYNSRKQEYYICELQEENIFCIATKIKLARTDLPRNTMYLNGKKHGE